MQEGARAKSVKKSCEVTREVCISKAGKDVVATEVFCCTVWSICFVLVLDSFTDAMGQ